MTPEEFKKILGAEPKSDDPDFVEARRSDLGLAALYKQALAEEDKISQALQVPVENRVDSILDACFEDEADSTPVRNRPAFMRVLPIAAAVLVAVGVAFVLPGTQNQVNAAPFVEHIAHHLDFSHDPTKDQNKYKDSDIDGVLKDLGLKFNGQIADVSYLSKCVIDEVESLHMVVSLESGEQFTVILVPGTDQAYGDGEVDDINAMVASLDQGTLFIYGHQEQPVADFANMMESRFS